MATTTPNFGWTVPTSSDLVKNGATAIETLGDAVDASLVDLLGGTTGQVLSKASGTDMDFTWATSTSGGMTLLSTTTLSGASTTITVTSGYQDIYAVIFGVTNATANDQLRCAPNGDTNLCTFVDTYSYDASVSNAVNRDNRILFGENAMLRTSASNTIALIINNYDSSTAFKPFQAYGYYQSGASNTSSFNLAGGYKSNTAITSLVFSNAGGNFSTGTVLLYGVK
jgi:hypothetical protein